MNEQLLQFGIVVAFGMVCFAFGFGAAVILMRNRWRDKMIERGNARYNWRTGKWEWPPR
jgi:hypothetical protein